MPVRDPGDLVDGKPRWAERAKEEPGPEDPGSGKHSKGVRLID